MYDKKRFGLPMMRTLPEAARELRQLDPETRLTLPVLRRLVKVGIIPCIYTGRKALVDMTELKEYLSRQALSPPVQGKIRCIDETKRLGK